jgi:hypothetical protein
MKTISMFLFKSGKLVSSAKIIGDEVVFMILGQSFIYNKKRRGPKIEPWGTPCLTVAQFETILLLNVTSVSHKSFSSYHAVKTLHIASKI